MKHISRNIISQRAWEMKTWPKVGIAAELIRLRLSHSRNTLIDGENNHHGFMSSFTTELSRRYISIQVCSQFNATTARYVKHEHPRCKARSSLATSHHMRTSVRPPSWRQTSQKHLKELLREQVSQETELQWLLLLATLNSRLRKWLPLLLLSPGYCFL